MINNPKTSYWVSTLKECTNATIAVKVTISRKITTNQLFQKRSPVQFLLRKLKRELELLVFIFRKLELELK